jgi:hypothetical protein
MAEREKQETMRLSKRRRKKDKEHATKETIPLPEMEHDILAEMEHNVKENRKELEEEQPKETIPITEGGMRSKSKKELPRIINPRRQ